MLRLERHRLGPRVYVCGLRIHEFALGFGVVVILLVGGLVEVWELTRRTEAAALFGAWLIGKDWRDLFPSKRNTASWSLLPHRVPARLIGRPASGNAHYQNWHAPLLKILPRRLQFGEALLSTPPVSRRAANDDTRAN